MAAGDLNDPLSNIPNIVLVDQSAATAAPGAGYGRLEVVNGVLGVRVGSGAWVALASLVAGLLTSLTEKVSPADTDLVLLQDEAAGSALKKVQISNLPGGGEATIPDPVDWSATLTVTQDGGRTYTAQQAKYILIGKLCILDVAITITQAGSAGNIITIGGLPAAAQPAVSGDSRTVGTFQYLRPATWCYVGALRCENASTLSLVEANTGNNVGVSPNIATVNGDKLSFTACYLVA